MAKPYDARLIAVVAQEQFEVNLNRFCKLVPVMYVDGTRPSPGDFPNDGEAWWMLHAHTAQLAEPGHLISCQAEDSHEYDEHDLTKSRFQAQRESVRDLNPKEDGLEVLDVPADAIDSLQDLVSGGYHMDLDHRPTPTVMLRWRSQVYGLFTATPDAALTADRMRVSFFPANADLTVYQVSGDMFREAAAGMVHSFSTEISQTHDRRSESFNLVSVKHDLLLAAGFEQVLSQNPKKLILEPIDRKLQRFAKQCLTRKKRQQLRQLLEELKVAGREAEAAEELAEAIGRIKQTTERQDAALDTVSKALLDSGVLGEDRLIRAEQEYAEKYVQDCTAELQAKIEENLKTNRVEARRVESELRDIQAKLQKEETQRRSQLEEELKAEQEGAREAIAAEREKLGKDKAELDRQEKLLKQNLEKVTQNLREAGDEVVNRFLAIAPLLGSTGLVGAYPPRQDRQPVPDDELSAKALELPVYVTSTAEKVDGGPTEKAFFERFCRVVEDSGFTYRLLDLQRFHLSVKCGELTVLGGPSGTGKSSLPSLYAQALLGEEADNGRTGCLMVNVNPSWMDIRDLLGHMNTLERRFYPAESGLFKHLVYAQEEYVARGTAAGLYLTCLDEMNLSQVEHYFSDFMMVLERRGADRTIQCFSAEVAGERCPFRKWSRISLPPSLRFVGTVNFDETTRLLSDRFLDRVDLIRLVPASLPGVTATDGGVFAKTQGQMVSLADFESWRTETALPSRLGSLLDQVRPFLATMGCPLSPRAYRGICRFVSSATEIMSSGAAFDAQMAQRIVPKIRSLVTRPQLDAMDNLAQALEGSTACSFEETMPLLDEVRGSAGMRGWDLEE